jgi:hypothetical protein
VTRIVCFVVVLAFGLAAASADEYWVAYEGNDFPENEGWTRTYGAGGADRWIEDGALVLDGRADSGIYDSYSMLRSLDPGTDEMFIMRWRLRVDQVPAGHSDPFVGVFSDESWAIGFRFSESRVYNVFDLSINASFEPGVYHRFEMRSWDMRSYTLAIDGNLTLTGPFVDVYTSSKIAWGDGVQGAASLSHWDCFVYGVVPEPATAIGFALVVTLRLIKNRHI